MTAQNTLRAALGQRYGVLQRTVSPSIFESILEAMEQHRRAGIGEVEAWCESVMVQPAAAAYPDFEIFGTALKAHLTVLKTPLPSEKKV